jgi:hypothetical protein
MIHRVAFFVASLTAALALAFGLAFMGVGPSTTPGGAVQQVAATVDPPPQPTVQVDTVYLTPPVAPQDVTVTKTVTGGGERDDGNERGEQD